MPIWIISHCVGLAVGYHRFLTHRSFKTSRWVEKAITICGSLTGQGGHIKWVADHRLHHAKTDQDGDPHSPRESFWWSHVGWVLWAVSPATQAKRNKHFAPDLLHDPFHFWLDRLWWLPSTLLGVILFAFGGFNAMLWGVFVPITFGLHFTWMVNSVCHRWGSRTHQTGDLSTNNWWVALLTWGEGWHNNHHDKPGRARHGLAWYQLDASWLIIQTLRLFDLVREVRT